jgi:hypothetical protein
MEADIFDGSNRSYFNIGAVVEVDEDTPEAAAVDNPRSVCCRPKLPIE